MLNISKHSKLSPNVVAEKAAQFFGAGGLGLSANITGESSTHFEGGGGFVDVEIIAAAHGSEVNVQSREWDFQAKQFLEKV